MNMLITPARAKFINTLSELDLPVAIWFVIVEYATSRKKDVVLRDIQQVGFCRDFLGYRRIQSYNINISYLNRLRVGPVIRKRPYSKHLHYGQGL